MSWIDKLLWWKKDDYAEEIEKIIEPKIEVEELEPHEFIEERALSLFIDALNAEKIKIITDAVTIARQNNREKISYGDMVVALQQNGFSVELADSDRLNQVY